MKKDKKYYDKLISVKIKEKRLLSSYSVNDIAAYIGVSHQQYRKYENGINRISAGNLYKIAELFKCNIEDLFNINTQKLEIIQDYEGSIRKKTKDATIVKLNRAFQKADDRVKKAILNILKS